MACCKNCSFTAYYTITPPLICQKGMTPEKARTVDFRSTKPEPAPEWVKDVIKSPATKPSIGLMMAEFLMRVYK